MSETRPVSSVSRASSNMMGGLFDSRPPTAKSNGSRPATAKSNGSRPDTAKSAKSFKSRTSSARSERSSRPVTAKSNKSGSRSPSPAKSSSSRPLTAKSTHSRNSRPATAKSTKSVRSSRPSTGYKTLSQSRDVTPDGLRHFREEEDRKQREKERQVEEGLERRKKEKNYGCCSLWQWGLGYHYPDHFIKSQYTFNQVFYIVYRIHMFLFVLANFIGRILWYNKTTAEFFMVYVTNWAMAAQVLYNLFDMILVLIQLEKKRRYPWDFLVNRDMTFFHGLSWFWSNINANMSLFVTFFYWIFVNPTNPETHMYFKLYAHVFMAVVNVFDVWFSAQPWRIHHFWCTWIFAVLYAIFGIVYKEVGGKTEENEDDIYHFMDWANVGQTLAVIGVCAVVIILIQIVLFSMYHLRLFFAQRCCGIITKDEVDDYYREYVVVGPINRETVEEKTVFIPAPVPVVTGDEEMGLANGGGVNGNQTDTTNDSSSDDEGKAGAAAKADSSSDEDEKKDDSDKEEDKDGMYPKDEDEEEEEKPEEPEEERWKDPFKDDDQEEEDKKDDSDKEDEEDKRSNDSDKEEDKKDSDDEDKKDSDDEKDKKDSDDEDKKDKDEDEDKKKEDSDSDIGFGLFD